MSNTMFHTLMSVFIATVLTAISYCAGLQFHFIKEINWLEVFSVWTSYSCTYLCVVQSRINYPIGAVSVAALCALFWTQSLYSSMILQIYLFPAMLYGWFRWGKDDDTRPVTRVGFDWWLAAYIAVPAIVYTICYYSTTSLGGVGTQWDSAILVLSILAQFLMDNKKIENWIIWLIVDIISVILYWNQGLQVLSIQMGLFGFNAIWGFYEWYKTMKVAKHV